MFKYGINEQSCLHSMLMRSFRPRLKSMSLICFTNLQKASLLLLAIRFKYCQSSIFLFSTNQGFIFPNHFFFGSPIPPSFSSKASSIEQRVRKQYYLTTFLFKTLKCSLRMMVYQTYYPIWYSLMLKVQSGMTLVGYLSNWSVSNVLFDDFFSRREGFLFYKKAKIIEPARFQNWESQTQGQSISLTVSEKKGKTACLKLIYIIRSTIHQAISSNIMTTTNQNEQLSFIQFIILNFKFSLRQISPPFFHCNQTNIFINILPTRNYCIIYSLLMKKHHF